MPIHVEVYAGIRGEEGHEDGPSKDAKFAFPETIVQHAGGDLIVSERGGPWLRLIDGQAVRTQQLVGRLNDGEVVLNPYGRVFMTQEGMLYANAEGSMWRAKWDPHAELLQCSPGPKVQLTTFVVQGEVILGATPATPTTGPKLIKIAWDGASEVVADLRSPGAGGVVMDANGVVFINEHARILRVSLDGQIEELHPTNVPPPQLGDRWFSDSMAGMALDGIGNLYVADTYGHVFSISPDGHVEIAVDMPQGPTDVLVSDDGFLYVADFDNHVILRSLDQVAPPP